MRKPRKKQGKKESKLQTFLSDYIRLKHPNTLFFCDTAAGMRTSIGVALLIKRWRSSNGFPDMYIFEPRGSYHMLQLELKSDDADLYKKDGTLRKTEHLETQYEMHILMKQRGFMAMFVKGRNHAVAVIEWYMAGAEGLPPSYQQNSTSEPSRQVDFFTHNE